MTKQQFDRFFVSEILPAIKKEESKYCKSKDIALRCQEYGYLLDSFHRDGQITDKQVQTWCIPTRLI